MDSHKLNRHKSVAEIIQVDTKEGMVHYAKVRGVGAGSLQDEDLEAPPGGLVVWLFGVPNAELVTLGLPDDGANVEVLNLVDGRKAYLWSVPINQRPGDRLEYRPKIRIDGRPEEEEVLSPTPHPHKGPDVRTKHPPDLRVV